MEKDPGMPLQPVADFFMLMSGIIIHDNMQVFLLLRLPLNGLEEFEKLFMCMLLIALPGHAAGDHLECGKQGPGPVSFIIMRDGSTAPFLEW